MTQLELLAYIVLYFAGLTVICMLSYLVVYHAHLKNDPRWQAIARHFRK